MKGIVQVLLVLALLIVVAAAGVKVIGSIKGEASWGGRASQYEEDIWEARSERERLQLKVDQQIAPYQVIGGRAMALLPAFALWGGVLLAFVAGAVWVNKAWHGREQVKPDKHGQVPTIVREVMMEDGTPATQIINPDKLPGFTALLPKGRADPLLPAYLSPEVVAEMLRLGELGHWAARTVASQPGMTADAEGFRKQIIALLNGQAGQTQIAQHQRRFLELSDPMVLQALRLEAGMEDEKKAEEGEIRIEEEGEIGSPPYVDVTPAFSISRGERKEGGQKDDGGQDHQNNGNRKGPSGSSWL